MADYFNVVVLYSILSLNETLTMEELIDELEEKIPKNCQELQDEINRLKKNWIVMKMKKRSKKCLKRNSDATFVTKFIKIKVT